MASCGEEKHQQQHWIPVLKPFVAPNAIDLQNQALQTLATREGGVTNQMFESQLRDFLDCSSTLTLTSLTTGFGLAVSLCGPADKETKWPGFDPRRDKVLVSSLAPFVTHGSVKQVCRRVRKVDVDLRTFNVSLRDLENKLDGRTKVLVLTLWAGAPLDWAGLNRLLDQHRRIHGFRPKVIQDCSQAMGAMYQDRGVAALADVSVFSLHNTHHLSAGSGCFLAFNNDEMFQKALRHRENGYTRGWSTETPNDDFAQAGPDIHLSELSAALGLANLPHLPKQLASRRENWSVLTEAFRNHPCLETQLVDPESVSACFVLSVRVLQGSVDRFRDHCHRHGVTTMSLPRSSSSSLLSSQDGPGDAFHVLSRELVSLPVGWWMTEKDVRHVIRVVCAHFRQDEKEK